MHGPNFTCGSQVICALSVDRLSGDGTVVDNSGAYTGFGCGLIPEDRTLGPLVMTAVS
jgi:hypothetical protein